MNGLHSFFLQSFEEGRVSVQVYDASIPMFYERLSIFGGKSKLDNTFNNHIRLY